MVRERAPYKTDPPAPCLTPLAGQRRDESRLRPALHITSTGTPVACLTASSRARLGMAQVGDLRAALRVSISTASVNERSHGATVLRSTEPICLTAPSLSRYRLRQVVDLTCMSLTAPLSRCTPGRLRLRAAASRATGGFD
jgi:hypothetical protein